MDEGRYGRISQLKACWAPPGVRPTVPRQVVRESLYAFAAVAPATGELVYRLEPRCNTEAMARFLLQILESWPDRRLILFLDGAGWHKSRALPVAERLRRIHLPAYSPECNPSEHIWDDTREKGFANRLFTTLEAVEVQLKTELNRLADDPDYLRSLTHFQWMHP
jgi:transposase